MGCEVKRGVQDGFRLWRRRREPGRMGLPSTRMGKTRQGVHDRGWEFRIGYNLFRHPREYSKLASGYTSLELGGEAGDLKFGDPNLVSTSV